MGQRETSAPHPSPCDLGAAKILSPPCRVLRLALGPSMSCLGLVCLLGLAESHLPCRGPSFADRVRQDQVLPLSLPVRPL